MDENAKAVLQRIPENQLHTFNNHPFTVRRDEAMEKLVDSVRVNGILNPVLVRPRAEGGYEIIAGHRRTEAGRILKLPYIPCFVCDLDDDHAIIAMIDSNLSQRENLPPSERAFALRMKAEAARRIMLATKGHGEAKRASENVAKDTGMSSRQVERFIKLTNLNRQLLNLLDAGKLGMDAAVELANLTTEAQCWIYDYINERNMTLNTVQAKKLRQALQPQDATHEVVEEILANPAKQSRKGTAQTTSQKASTTVKPASDNRPPVESRAERPPAGQEPPIVHDPLVSVRNESPIHETVTTSTLVSAFHRIREMFPPGMADEAICDSVCRTLEAIRGFKEYYPPGLPEAVILEDIQKMLHVKRPHIIHVN